MGFCRGGNYENHQEAYKVFSKSIESIKRKQIDQEFSNGKGENKKKKFDFKGEMKKFNDQQQKTIENVKTEIQSSEKTSLTNETTPSQQENKTIKINSNPLKP